MVSTPNPDIALALAEETLADLKEKQARFRAAAEVQERLVADAQRAVDDLLAAPKKPLREGAKRTNKKGRTS